MIVNKEIIESLVKVKLNNNQLAALDSFIKCRGISAFKNSNLLKVINKNNFLLVDKELSKWIVSNGRKNEDLRSLRQQEIKLFSEKIDK